MTPDISNLAVGDRITFRSPTRNGSPKLTRIVNGFWPNGMPTVRANGCPNFVVDAHEIHEIETGEPA